MPYKIIPREITAIFESKISADEKIRHIVYSDLDQEHKYSDCYTCLTDRNIYIMYGKLTPSKKQNSADLEYEYTIDGFRSVEIIGQSKLTVKRFISTAALIMEYGGNYSKKQEILKFSIGYAAGFQHLADSHNNPDKAKKPKHTEQELFCPVCKTRYPEPERKVCPKCISKFSVTVRLLGFFRPYIKYIVMILLFLIVSTLVSLITPLISSQLLFDEVLAADGKYYGRIVWFILIFLGVRILTTALSIIFSSIVSSIMPYVVYDIKVRIFSAMQKLSMSFYTSKQTGSLMARVDQDAENIYWFLVDGAPYAIMNIITFLGIFLITFRLSPLLCLIIFITLPICFFLLKLLSPVFRRLHHSGWVNRSRLSSFLSDSITGHRVIKAFAKEKEEYSRFEKYSEKVLQSELKLSNTEATAFPLIELLMHFCLALILGFGGIMVTRGNIELGTLLAFISYMWMLFGPLGFMSNFFDWWTRCIDSAVRIFEILDAKPDIVNKEDAARVDELDGNIEVKNIKFEYEPGLPVIKNLSLSIKSGQMIGIVGKTGAGKSTIVNLLARLYEPTEGIITIDGMDIRDINIDDLRKNISIVSQDIYLFSGTIADNIRYAKQNATIEEIIDAAKAASAHEFIMKLPDGYETWLGAQGQELSGGEKQRISIARTIIQNPRILILDEATSSMDTQTERSIQESISRLKEGRTTISIAHRLSTLRDADLLAVVADGNVVEYGTAKELIEKKGEYYKLYILQMEALKHIGIQ